MANTNSTNSPPSSFVCPMTLEVMKTPVTHCHTGQTFERDAILQWIYTGNLTCPLTRTNIHPSDFKDNLELKQCIAQWQSSFSDNDDTIQHHDDDESDFDDDSFFEGIIAMVEPMKRSLAQQRDLRRLATPEGYDETATASTSYRRTSTIRRSLQEQLKEKRLSDIRDRVLNGRDARLRSLGETAMPLASMLSYGCI